jgi:hypothetical protein
MAGCVLLWLRGVEAPRCPGLHARNRGRNAVVSGEIQSSTPCRYLQHRGQLRRLALLFDPLGGRSAAAAKRGPVPGTVGTLGVRLLIRCVAFLLRRRRLTGLRLIRPALRASPYRYIVPIVNIGND